MEDISKVGFALSKLAEINTKRSDRYLVAAEKVKSVYLKTVFMNFSFQAQQLNNELNRWLRAYKISLQPKQESFMDISWEKIKSRFIAESENKVCANCESLEEESMKGYNTAIELSFIPPEALRDVKRQMQYIERVRENLRSMRHSNSNRRQLQVA